jgi:cytoskeletal protein RodZ
MASLGQELKKQRESRNISIDEMASSTKIVGRYLEALEQDRFDAMPGGFFINGIVRTYAKYVGLDEDDILAKYKAAGAFEEPPKMRSPDTGTVPDDARKRRLVVWIIAGAGLLLFLIALTVLWRSRRPRFRSIPPAPQTAMALPQARPTNAAPPPVQKSASEPASAKEEWKGLTMDITFQEEAWIQIDADGTPRVSRLFPAGEKARVQAEKEILISVLGNAGGLTFLLNGQPGKALGRSGEILKDIRITLDNQKDFLRNKQPTGPTN